MLAVISSLTRALVERDDCVIERDAPLRETLSALENLTGQFYDIGELENPAWFPSTDLINLNSPVLDQSLARQTVRYSGMDARTQASFFVNEFSWYFTEAAIGSYLMAKRVPDLSAENIVLRFSTYIWHEDGESGEAERLDVRFLSGRFACLPDDSAADHPDAQVLPNVDALRDQLRTTLESYLTPIIDRLYEQTRLSRHAQWLLVADACAAQFLQIGRKLGNGEHSQAEGLAFIKAASSPMHNDKTGYFVPLSPSSNPTVAGCCSFSSVFWSSAGPGCWLPGLFVNWCASSGLQKVT